MGLRRIRSQRPLLRLTSNNEEPVIERLHQAGATLRAEIRQLASAKGPGGYFEIIGRDCNLVCRTLDADVSPSQHFRTLFFQERIRRGLLMPSLVTSLGHGEAEIAYTIEAVDQALDINGRALEDGVSNYLRGRPVRPVFPSPH